MAPLPKEGEAPTEAPEGDSGAPIRSDGERVPGREACERGFATARPGGRLRRRAGGRRRIVKVMLSPEEEAWVVPKAAAEGLSVQRFLVESALPEGRPSLLARRALYREFFAARRDLSGACANLNQLAHLGNQRRAVPTGVEASVADVKAAMERLVELAGLLVAHAKRTPGGAEER
jgi:Bacterial mobilisation protein (MobC)